MATPCNCDTFNSNVTINGTATATEFAATDHVALTTGFYPRIQSDVANTALYVGASNSNSGNVLVVSKNDFSNPSNYLMTVTNGGLVGIGKTNPAQPLDVNGTVSATGLLLGGDILLYGALKDSTSNRTNVDAGGCYYAN